jgi:hypothetical protein
MPHSRRTQVGSLLNWPQAAALIAALALPLPSLAWGGITTGKISQMDVANARNLPFRVHLEGSPVLCEGGLAEGYVDDADANYKVYVAALMMAKATGATVTLYADVGAVGRCRIGYVTVR